MLIQISKCSNLTRRMVTTKIRDLNAKRFLSGVHNLHDNLFEKLVGQSQQLRDEFKRFKNNYGERKVQDITVNNITRGMRGMTALICHTSFVDPIKGLMFHNIPLNDLLKTLPKNEKAKYPSPESIFFFMLTGEIPTIENVANLSKNLLNRMNIPLHTVNILKEMKEAHPMTQFVTATASLSTESTLEKSLSKIDKNEMWKSIFDECLSLIAKTTTISAGILKNLHKKDSESLNELTNISGKLSATDMSEAFIEISQPESCYSAEMLVDFLKLYQVLHCDHEGGNVSTHANSLVGSAHTNPFLCFAAALSGLSGPLHGRACQEVLDFIDRFHSKYSESSVENIAAYIRYSIENKLVIPGFGHAVLRAPDQRCMIQWDYASKNLSNVQNNPQKSLHMACKMLEIVPPILEKYKKIANPYPNIDAISGSIIKELITENQPYYTVMFGMARAYGCMANLIINHILGFALERPKSITIEKLKEQLDKNK